MLKWLRKYNKMLLIVFGVFLMVAFLVQGTLSQVGRDSGAVIKIDGRGVSAREAQRSKSVVDAVSALTFGQFPVSAGVDPRGVDHWLLAREAARRSGFFGGASDGTTIITPAAQIAVVSRMSDMDRMRMQFDPEFVRQVQAQIEGAATSSIANRGMFASRYGLLDRELDEGLAATSGMLRMRQAYVLSPRLSEKRLMRKARETLDQAEMQVLFIGLDPAALSTTPDPSEEALQEHFNKYRDKAPPAPNSPTATEAFGYLRPRRFKVEYLTLDRAAIEKAVRVSPVDVQKRLMGNSMKQETDPAKRRAAIEAEIRRELTNKVMQEATLAYRGEVLSATRTLSDDGFYKTATPKWLQERPRLTTIGERIVAKVKDQTGVDMPLPAVAIRDRDWLSDAEVQKLPGLGTAIVPRGNDAIALGQLLPQMKELLPPGAQRPEVAIQAGVPFAEPLEDYSGNRYFLTVLDARPESPADSLAEVRAQVINDRKRADAYAKLAAQIPMLETLAVAQGLDALREQVLAQGGLTADIRSGARVSRGNVSPGDAPFNTQAFREAASSKMAVLDPTIALDRAPPSDLHVAVALPARLGVAVGRFTAYSPATLETFRQRAGGLATSSVSELVKDREAILGRDQLMKRLHAEFPGSRSPANKDKPADASAPVPASEPAPTK